MVLTTPRRDNDRDHVTRPGALGVRPAPLARPRIALVCVAPDANRGSCALTWAAIDCVVRAFSDAEVGLLPTSGQDSPAADPFRHTRRRYPSLQILPPLYTGVGLGRVRGAWRLARSLRDLLQFDPDSPGTNSSLEWLRECDLVVSVGGVKFATVKKSLRHDAGLVVSLLPLWAAQKMGIPVALLATQVGPLRTRLSRFLFGRMAASAAMVFPRDRESAFESRTWAQRSTLVPDSAFGLDLSSANPRELPAHRRSNADGSTVALVISSALRAEESGDAHVALFAHVGRRLLESGLAGRIVVVIQADEDAPISRHLARELRLDARFVIDDDLSPDQLTALYGECRMVVSSRLHGVILALLAGVPAVVLAPEVTFKERAVLEMVGLGALCVPAAAGPERAADACLHVLSEEHRWRQAVHTAVSAARAALEDVPRRLREIARDHAGRRRPLRNMQSP